ncbi:hypothetical protein WJX73_000919 [Symbiochloris irregularis]|uniref:Uncharacterized protein n=1 Tax=Symbiochloris irregularis TaxID=706552 RepID=A0AAW1NR76_9CHLO
MGSKTQKKASGSHPLRKTTQSAKDAEALLRRRQSRLAEQQEVEAAAANIEAAGRKRQASRALSTALDDIPEVPAPAVSETLASEQPSADGVPPPPPSSAPPAAAAAAREGSASAANASTPAQMPQGPVTNEQLMAILPKLVDSINGVMAETATLRAQAAASRVRETAAEARAKALQARVGQLESSVARASARSEDLDRTQRANKMVFFGVSSSAADNLVETTRAHLRGVGCAAASKITAAVRLGPARAATDGARARPSPVKVTFSSEEDVYDVFKACRALREQRKVYVDRDLTAQQRATRVGLQQEYKGLRENGYHPFWRGEKLFYAPVRGARPMEVTPGCNLPAAPQAQARA